MGSKRFENPPLNGIFRFAMRLGIGFWAFGVGYCALEFSLCDSHSSAKSIPTPNAESPTPSTKRLQSPLFDLDIGERNSSIANYRGFAIPFFDGGVAKF